MFGAFSKLFKKSESAPAPARSTGLQTTSRAAPPPPKNETAGKTPVSRPAAGPAAGGDALVIPYSAIIKLIPQELWGKLAPAGVAGYNFTIPRKSVLEQLPHGAVKVSFGELRRSAPNGVFISSTNEDTRLVDLPLSEILEQLHPDAISRRTDQARIEVSEDVPDLFGAKGERLAPLRVMEKKEVSNTTSFARQKGSTAFTPKPAVPMAPPAPPLPAGNIARLPAQPAAPQPPAAPVVPAPPPAPAPTVIRMQPTPAAPPAAASKAPAPIQFPAAKPAVPAPSPAAAPAKPLPKLPVAGSPKPQAPASAPASTPIPLSTGAFLIALDVIASSWPDGVRQELAQLKIPDAKLALPPVDICEGLKRGRIQFPWRTLRGWIQPTPIYATPSPHDDTMLELPLRTLTPLFLDFIRSNPVNRQVADAENITEFFRKAEQATGTAPELLQPLFTPAVPPGFTPPSAAPAAPPPGFTPVPAPTPAPAAQSSAAPGSSTEPSVENNTVCLPLPLIANGWPEPVMHDIASFGLGGSRVEIPLANIEPGLKCGRIEFTWRELCGWLNPPSKPAQVSINGENRLALPLGLIAPLYMKARGAAQARKKTNVAEDIPDLFSAAGKPLQPPPPAEAPAATPAPAAPAAPAPTAAPAPRKVPTNLSELFNEPDKKTWTPNEIVQRSTQLPNVAGTLIALQDGLLVASNMPEDFKTDTIAAFVPQIFGRMNQYSKELQMGDIRAVSFTVESGTVQVYNAGIIYFAAIGRGNDLLPLAELQLIAGELSRHTK